MDALSRVIRALLVMGIAGMARLVLAADPAASQSIDIPAQDLGTALLKFAALTHQQIAFDPKLVSGYESTALSGTYTLADGLHAIIGAAPLMIHTTPSGVITVAAAPVVAGGGGAQAAAEQLAVPATAASSPSASARVSQAPPEVIVSTERQAQRAELEPRISAFVKRISGSNYDPEGVARWQKDVCPLVSGLSGKDGEFILARVSEIARAAGVPLAGEECRPNLYIMITSEPQSLLKEMEAHNQSFTYGGAPSHLIDQFISKPRAVRVWYHTAEKTPEGMPLLNLSGPNWNSAETLVGPEGSQAVDNQSPLTLAGAIPWSQATHLTHNLVWDVFRVFVIVDTTRLQGVSRGQIADYIAMVALAQIKVGGPAADSPTILKLFDGAPQTAPAGMSDWDRAFLKSLYVTEQKSNLQRAMIVREMLREVVP